MIFLLKYNFVEIFCRIGWGVLGCLLLLVGLDAARASTLTWNNAAGGSWNTQANWGTGTLPTATADTAVFTNLDINADVSVTLDSNQNVGSLIFGDLLTNSAAGWNVNTGALAGATLNFSTAANITVNALGVSKVVTMNSPMSGSGTLNINGVGTFTLNAPANFSGNASLAGGIKVNMSGGEFFGGSPNLIFQNATLTAGNNSGFALTNDLVINAGQAGTINFGTGASSRLTLSGNMTGSGTINLVLFSSVARDDLSGDFSDFIGTVNLSGNGQARMIQNGGQFVGWPNATVVMNAAYLGGNNGSTGSTYTFGSLSGTNPASVITVYYAGPNVLIVGGNNQSTTFAGQITGTNCTLTKIGAGTFTLTGTNTYTGATLVQAGTLIVNGSLTSDVTIAAGATLGGTGTITGKVWRQVGSTLHPGNTLNITGGIAGVSQPDGSSMIVQFATNALGVLVVSNAITLSGGDIFVDGIIKIQANVLNGKLVPGSYQIVSGAATTTFFANGFVNAMLFGAPAGLTARLDTSQAGKLFLVIQPTAFPGAEGFAAGAWGGRLGSVYHVVNLNDSGPGSFRDAVSQPNRTVVFDVGGAIKLTSGKVLVHNNITIAGQTAPGDGISIYNDEVTVAYHTFNSAINDYTSYGYDNIIFRYVRFRGITGTNVTTSLHDCFEISPGSNIMIDHCSFAWCQEALTIDGTFAPGNGNGNFFTPPANITLQNCIAGETTRKAPLGSGTPSDPEQFGALFDGGNYITLKNFLWIDNTGRNPKVKCDPMQLVNNVIYNWGGLGLSGGHSSADHHADYINNYYVAGPSSSANSGDLFFGYGGPTAGVITDYVYDNGSNYVDYDKGGTLNGRLVNSGDWLASGDVIFSNTPFASPAVPVTADAARLAYKKIASDGGVTQKAFTNGVSAVIRDSIEARMISQMNSRGTAGSLIGFGNDINSGTYSLTGGTVAPDSSQDGMPDFWKKTLGLSTHADNHLTPVPSSNGVVLTDSFFPINTPAGYTYLEEYLHFLATPHAIVTMNIAGSPSAVDAELNQFMGGFRAPLAYVFSNVVGGTVSLLADGHTARFVPTLNYAGRAGFDFKVTDADGDTWTRRFAVLVSSVSTQPSSLVWKGDGTNNVWDDVANNWLKTDNILTSFTTSDNVTFDDTGTNSVAVNLAYNVWPGSVTVNASKNYIFNGAGDWIGSGALTKSGSGTLTLWPNATLSSSATNGSKIVAVATATLFPSLIVSGTNIAAGTTISDIIDASHIVLSQNATNTGTANLTYIATNSNAFSGGAILNGGTVALGSVAANQSALGSGLVQFNGGGLVVFNAGIGIPGAGIFPNDLVVNTTGTLAAAPRGVVSGDLSGNGTLSLITDYVRSDFTGNWTAFAGQVRVGPRSGTAEFRIGNAAGFPNGAIYLSNGITSYLLTSSATCDFGELYGSSGATLGPGNGSGTNPTWRIGAKNTSSTFDGVITNAGVTTVIKVGSGALTLTGANSYSGGTTVSNGTLLVDNASGSGTGTNFLNVYSGATLGGTGIISGLVTINSGGTLAPGNPTGVLTVSNNLILNTGATSQFALGTTSDRIFVSGNLALAGTLNVTNAGGLAPGTNRLFDYSGTLSGTLALGSMPAGFKYLLNTNTAKQVNLLVLKPQISSVNLGGANLIFSGSGGIATSNYFVLSATNLSLPTAQWTRLATNVFTAGGNFAFTNPITAGRAQMFYQIQFP